MLDLAILAILLIGFIVGLRRGFILQLIHLTGFFVAFVAAYSYYNELAPKLTLWIPFPTLGGDSETMNMFIGQTNLEEAYYRAIAFAIIFFATKLVWQLFGSMLDFISNLPILKQLNRWAGAILGFAEVYLIMFILLYIAALLPMANVQDALNGSFLADLIVKNTPYLSGKVTELWFQYVAA
ncbi:CvpA family protein [Bacillus cihuensis]|uniref:CvpA family protein n=1 Tax=Bacillus cihuensis TaxID=1208599 RepID=UPI0004025B27|nr:CvpA family protein [Bacillus cihuensis]